MSTPIPPYVKTSLETDDYEIEKRDDVIIKDLVATVNQLIDVVEELKSTLNL